MLSQKTVLLLLKFGGSGFFKLCAVISEHGICCKQKTLIKSSCEQKSVLSTQFKEGHLETIYTDYNTDSGYFFINSSLACFNQFVTHLILQIFNIYVD